MEYIAFPRKGADGKERSQNDIENNFANTIEEEIRDRLKNLRKTTISLSPSEVSVLDYLLQKDKENNVNNLRQVLLSKPEQLLNIEICDIKYTFLFIDKKGNSTAFSKLILEQFNYAGYRTMAVMRDLSSQLNIKTCPYCNEQYTLAINDSTAVSRKTYKWYARHQFDHFFSKSRYPFLSMSLYNLIPSCSNCNISKSKQQLDIRFNPYHNDISSTFHFEVANPIDPWVGDFNNDSIMIKVVGTPDDKEFNKYSKTFHLQPTYARHKDVAEEVFRKAYAEFFYSRDVIWKEFGIDATKVKEVLYGLELSSRPISNSPLSKLSRDLWLQARNLITSTKK